MTTTYADLAVGDRVWCLAWVGQPFEVVAKDDELEAVAIETPDGWPTHGRIDILPPTMFMLTTERWDAIWHWPDRAGERYEEVFDRFLATHEVGQLVTGQVVPSGLEAVRNGLRVVPDPARSMAFRIDALDRGFGQVRVHPVVAVDGAEVRCGPTVPLRMEMRTYRWCLTFGELVLGWEDL